MYKNENDADDIDDTCQGTNLHTRWIWETFMRIRKIISISEMEGNWDGETIKCDFVNWYPRKVFKNMKFVCAIMMWNMTNDDRVDNVNYDYEFHL